MTVQSLYGADPSVIVQEASTLTLATLYPLLIERQLVRRIWGGQQIATWLDLPEPRPAQLGESWEVFDTNVILNGALAGLQLDQITRYYGASLVGTRTTARYGTDFPLLTKFLDAAANGSIQVHPDDAYAHTYEAATGFHGKNEAWYILRAEPGATVVSGLKRPCSRAEFAAAVEAGCVEELLHFMPVQAGDTIFIPAGTVHTINAGILLFEVQEKSDLTYRVYDYGRIDSVTGKPRELHLDKALDVINFAAPPRHQAQAVPLDNTGLRLLLMTCPYFVMEHWTVPDEYRWTTSDGSLEILTVIENQGILQWEGGSMYLKRGDSVVLPATLGDCELRPVQTAQDTNLCIVRAYVPEP